MEDLNSLIRNLAIIVLLAGFLEMMLPSKSMLGFVKLIMGLFVISAILNPITSLLRMPLEMNIPAWTETTDSDMPVLASGEEGEQIGIDAVEEQFKMIIKNQIKALTLGIPGVKNAEVAVELEKGSGGLTDQPQINQIRISINAESQEIKPVENVVIGGDHEITPETRADISQELSPLGQEVREKVAALMQLSADKIFVVESF